MKTTMQYGCALVLAISTLPTVAQAAFTTPVPAAGESRTETAAETASEGAGLNIALPAGSYALDPGQVKDELFAGTEKFEKGASDVTNVNLDGKTLGMVGGGKEADVAHKLNFVVVHSYKYDKPGMYSMEDVEVFRKKLQDGSWNCFIHTKDKDGTTDICSKGKDGENHEMVILTAEPLELTFVHLSGTMSFSDLGKMGGGLGIVPPPPPPPTPPAH